MNVTYGRTRTTDWLQGSVVGHSPTLLLAPGRDSNLRQGEDWEEIFVVPKGYGVSTGAVQVGVQEECVMYSTMWCIFAFPLLEPNLGVCGG